MEEAKEAKAVELRLEPMYVPATVTADWDAITANVRRMVAPYEGVTADEAALMDLKEAKACCADLRRISRELNDGRKAVKRKYNEPLAAFEAKVKEIDALIQQPLAVVDEAVKIAERRERDERRARLEQAYEDFAPALAPVVPFERVLEPQWLNKSFGQRKAELRAHGEGRGHSGGLGELQEGQGRVRLPRRGGGRVLPDAVPAGGERA